MNPVRWSTRMRSSSRSVATPSRTWPPRPTRLRRHYKIQEVIKRRQILLIQVVKEERGNKGAALTTYLSLAGRYSVLMPNTARGGGISRKITDGEDRKRLKAIAQDLDVPEGMGVILRTAGAARSKIEVRRDFEYLLRMWESVRELTLKSTAPTLVYEEGSLIKTVDPRSLWQRRRGNRRGRHRRVQRSARLHAHAHAGQHQQRAVLSRPAADLREIRRRSAARCHVLEPRDVAFGRLSGHQPDRGAGGDRRQLGPFDSRA